LFIGGGSRENRNALLNAHDEGFIDDEEFLMLYDVNRSTNLDLPYWDYEQFDLDDLCNDECKAEFRFLKNDIYTLYEVLQIPEEMKCVNGFKVLGLTALCVLLKRFAYPCRYLGIMPRFALSVPQLSMISNLAMNFVYDRWGRLLQTFEQEWLNFTYGTNSSPPCWSPTQTKLAPHFIKSEWSESLSPYSMSVSVFRAAIYTLRDKISAFLSSNSFKPTRWEPSEEISKSLQVTRV
ncbi:Hypothetical predicted protein, partial [Paramuricea clavata]